MSARQATAKNNRKKTGPSAVRLLVAAVALIALAGLVALRASDAATTTLAIEAEIGQTAGNASLTGDPSGTGASGGLVVLFKAP